MKSGLRRRLVLLLIGLVALTAAVVGTLSVVIVDRSLRAARVGDAVAAAQFNLTVLAPAAGLPTDPTPADVEASGLLDRFLRRGTDGVWVEFDDGAVLATPGQSPIAVSSGLRSIASAGELSYEFTESPDGLVLVTAGQVPPGGPTFFFVTSARPITDATRLLALVVTGAGLAVVALGALAATSVARRMLRPVAAASRAATRMAGGDLAVRLADEGPDEFGRLSASFNDMAASLEQSMTQLEEARARERRFVADVSHELRTPVTSLVNAAALLRSRLDAAPPETARLGEMVDTEARRLRHLVDDLLEISRLDLGSGPPAAGPVDVAAFLAALIAARLPSARLVTTLTAPVAVDGSGLERIVGNLLDNARIHAPGAEVTVAASVVESTLVVEVADRGPGVAPDDLDRIFERFATADPARAGGTGLGLAIAAEHAARLGGSVAAALRPGGGLAVTARLPVGELLHDGDGPATGAGQADAVHPQGDRPA